MDSENTTTSISAPSLSAETSTTCPPPATSTSSPSSAAAASTSITISQHLANTHTLQETLNQLTSIFNFPHHLSKLAIDECGPEDVTACYNWILDHYHHGSEVEDAGGPVVPRGDCPHLERHLRLTIIDHKDNDNNGRGSKLLLQIQGNNGEPQPLGDKLSIEFQRLCLEGNLMTSACQHYNYSSNGGLVGKRIVSRKRLRSEEDYDIHTNNNNKGGLGKGNLKCEEDYENDTQNENEASSSSLPSSDDNKPASCCPKGENWLCLECGALLCSRYANGHAKLHYQDTKEAETEDLQQQQLGGAQAENKEKTAGGHCVAVSLADLSVWCYECNAYLEHPRLEVITKHLEELKFGNNKEEDENNGNGDDEGKKESNDEDVRNTEGITANINAVVDSTNYDDHDVACGKEGIKYDMEVEECVDTMKSKGDHTATKNDGSMKVELSTNNGSSSSKRKGMPRKLPPDQLGTSVSGGMLPQNQKEQQEKGSNDGAAANDSDDSSSSSSSSDDNASQDGDNNSASSSDDDDGEDQAALIASLLQSEHGDAIRAYLARHESFDTANLGQCVPMHMPKPPTFPNEIADFLKSPLCKSIIVLAGAGMSVSSGIPDFRSAGIGLYDTLRPELLTASELERALIEDEPTLALDKGMFLQNPLPMLETKRSFILGTYEKKWKATLAHRFVEMLHTKLGKLTRLYTQNIDGLELQTDLPREKVVNVHGSMGAAACEQCEHEVDFTEFCETVRTSIKDITGLDVDAPQESTPITCEACGNPTVKPTIVLFRGSMPKEFHVRCAEDLPECDLLIIMGTSLTVAPANSLVYRIPPTALRMVLNNERVGRRLGIDYSENSIRDVHANGYTDTTCLELCEKMGWLDDLAEIVDELPESSSNLLRERLARKEEEGGSGDNDDE